MATISGGVVSPNPSIIGGFGEGMAKGWMSEGDRLQKQEDMVFATTVKMYQEATEEDRKLLERSPGWPKILKMAEAREIPLIQTPSGGRGFAVGVPSLKRQEAEEAMRFPGQAGAPGIIPLPSGAAGYGARKEALKAAMSGELRQRNATSGYYEAKTNLADKEYELAKFKTETEAMVKKGLLTEEQARTALEGRKVDILGEEAKSQGLFRKGTLAVHQGTLAETIRENNLRYSYLTAALAEKQQADAKGQLSQYTNFNKEFSRIKTDLRQPLKMAERDQAVQQAFGHYMSYKNTVDPRSPIQVAGLQGATGEMMSLLVDEIVRGAEPGSKIDEQRIRNYLDTIAGAAGQGLIDPTVLRNIQSVLRAAGYSQNVKTNAWTFPTQSGGWFSGWLGGGGTP